MSGFFALFDDIAALMDDVAVMSKVAAKKTAAILGDDLAVNAEKASGFVSSRELPVLWAITKGSLLNKAIILPFAFLLSAFLPQAIPVILMLGGIYLAFEGAEKIYDYFKHKAKQNDMSRMEKLSADEVLEAERLKIKSAIRTDFILSIEIVVIALGTVLDEPLLVRVAVVSFVALLATVGVYGIVALIVRMDDIGYALIAKAKSSDTWRAKLGIRMVRALPRVIVLIGVIGTIAMLLVAGGIYLHHIEALHHIFEGVPSLLAEFVIGLALGFATLGVVETVRKLSH